MADLSSLLQVVLNALAQAPPDANPFLVIKAAIPSALTSGSRSKVYEAQLILQGSVAVMIALVITASLIIRVMKGQFWVVRSRSGYILPHFIVGWTSFAVLFFLLLLGYSLRTLAFVRGHSVRDMILWQTLVWIPAWLAGWLVMWVLLVTYLEQALLTGTTFDLAPPWAINSFTIITPILFCISTCTFGALASRPYTVILDLYNHINLILDSKAKEFAGSFTLADLEPQLELAKSAVAEADELQLALRRAFWAIAGWGILLLLCLLVSAFLQLRQTRRSLSFIMAQRRSSSQADDFGLSLEQQDSRVDERSLTNDTGSDNESALRQSFGSLLWTVGTFVVINVTDIGFCIYTACTSGNILRNTHSLKIVTLGNVYCFLIPAIPVSVLLLVRAIKQQPLASSNPNSSPRIDMASTVRMSQLRLGQYVVSETSHGGKASERGSLGKMARDWKEKKEADIQVDMQSGEE